MPHITGDHNEPIVRLYTGDFKTTQGDVILECWSIEHSDAAIAFHDYFEQDHPDSKTLADKSLNGPIDAFSADTRARRQHWLDLTQSTPDFIEFSISPGTRLAIGNTVIEHSGKSYLCWSKAFCPMKPSFI